MHLSSQPLCHALFPPQFYLLQFFFFFFFIIVVQLEQFRQTRRTICWKKQIHDASERVGFAAKLCLFISFVFIEQQGGRKAHKIINSQKSGAPYKHI